MENEVSTLQGLLRSGTDSKAQLRVGRYLRGVAISDRQRADQVLVQADLVAAVEDGRLGEGEQPLFTGGQGLTLFRLRIAVSDREPEADIGVHQVPDRDE
ncbi:hypothetical protein GCM10020256_10390 [Streptomyces thermocoprophilus]